MCVPDGFPLVLGAGTVSAFVSLGAWNDGGEFLQTPTYLKLHMCKHAAPV